MSLTGKLFFSSLRIRPLRYLLSIFGIVLGVATILGIGITNQSALNSVRELFEDVAGKSDLVITAASFEDGGFPDSVLYKAEKVPGVKSAIPSVIMQTSLAEGLQGDQTSVSFMGGTGTEGLTLYGIDPQKDKEVRELEIVAGKPLQPDLSVYDVVLVDSFAEKNDIEIGRSIEIITERGVEKLKVVGLMSKEGPGRLNNGNFGVLPILTAQKLAYKENEFDQIDLIAEEEFSDSDDLESLREDLEAIFGEDYTVTFPASQGGQTTQMLQNFQIGLNFLSAMALFVGAFLIYNAFSMSIVERTREFGMLRTVGMTRSQLIFQVITEAALIGFLGSLAGIGLGILISQGLSNVMSLMMGQSITSAGIPQETVVIAFFVGFFTSIFAALLPAFQAGRTSPLEAVRIRSSSRISFMAKYGWIFGSFLLIFSAVLLIINPFPNDPQFMFGSLLVIALFVGGALIIPATVNIWGRIFYPFVRLLFGRIGKLGSSNIGRTKIRSTLTIAALMVGVAMVVITWIMTDSFKGDLEGWLDGYMGGDLYISSAVPMKRDVQNRLLSVEGVQAVAPVRYFQTEWSTPEGNNETISIMAVEPQSYTEVTSFTFVQNGSDPLNALNQLAVGDSVFISSVIAEKHDLKPGDSILINTRRGLKDFYVSAIIVDFYNQGMVITGSWNDMARYFRYEDANLYLVYGLFKLYHI